MQILAQESRGEVGLRKWFHKDNLIILVLAGILLFVISLPTEDRATKTTKKDVVAESGMEAEAGETASAETSLESALDEYAAAQEDKLEQLLAAMEGVGSVEVMLTFVSSEELVVEKDAPTVRSNTVEKDSAGGNRTISDFETGDTTVYSNISGDSIPYVVKTLNPRVDGVLVVAQGASNGEISQNITEAVCALYGIEAQRVKVLDMGSTYETGTSRNAVKGLSGS